VVGFWVYNRFTRDLPRLTKIEDYRPPAVTSILDGNDTLLGEFYTEQRYPVRLHEVPLMIRNCFLAAEDASFYTHPGIDIISIIRAMVKNLRDRSVSQGASTITQQVVKNLLLTSQRKLERKVKEAILAYRLEQRFTKDEIFEIYLNQMFFGNGAYGIKAAAKNYYHKELAQLTLAEAALLAGLLKAPSAYSPVTNLNGAKRRQRYVLGQMVRAGFATKELTKAAFEEPLTIYPALHEKVFQAPYFIGEVRRLLIEHFGSEQEVDEGGYRIITTVDLNATRYGEDALRRGLREVDKRRGWRGALRNVSADVRDAELERLRRTRGEHFEAGKVYPALVTKVARGEQRVWVDLGNFLTMIDLASATWARRFLSKEDTVTWGRPVDRIQVGDLIEVVPIEKKDKDTTPLQVTDSFELDQTPEIEGALVTLDPHSGQVIVMVGGYDYQRSQFNRVTQSLRQPGSSFKPVLYLAALEAFGYTPATIVYDQPRQFRVGDQVWEPENFDENFLGPITFRTALEKSRNLASVDLVSRIGLDAVIEYAAKLGIRSKIGRNLSVALGSSEVTLLELARAYGVFAARGVLVDSALIRRIEDRNGTVLFDLNEKVFEHAQQVIKESSAFMMANLMKGVVERGTGSRVKALGRPVAGKTGTSNEDMDTWFIGYTPEWVAGVWVGFDLKRNIGDKETGGRVAAPIFLNFMRNFLAYEDERKYIRMIEENRTNAAKLGIEEEPVERPEALDFSVPEDVDPFWMNRQTGFLSGPEDPEALYEYFVRGTEPRRAEGGPITQQYLDAPDL
jgi:penicillin-binding protein 1A